MNDIVRPIAEDGNIGFDQYNQLILQVPHPTEPDWSTIRPIADLRAATCSICGHDWDLNAQSWDDSFVWNRYNEYVHESCMVRRSALHDRDTFFSALVGARVRFKGLEPIENRYWRGADRWSKRHWYRAELIDHPVDFTLGSRKRVTHIEVKPIACQLDWWEAAAKDFATEDVTKSFGPSLIYIHAWSEEKEREYVRRFAEIGGLQIERKKS